MSLAPRILAAAGLLAVPVLLAIGSQALTRPADVPLEERQVVVIDLAPTGGADPGTGGDSPAAAEPEPGASAGSLIPPSRPSATAPSLPEPTPAPSSIPPTDQGNPGLVEREVFDDDMDDDSDDSDDGVDSDDNASAPDGED